jgi:3-oxoadipyl-CoA thiolase
MADAYICDPIRTPIGRYGGALSAVRADDLAALPIRALLERNEKFEPVQVEDLALGCANQAGEDNRNVARMAVLLGGLPVTVPGVTINRLCGSGMNAVGNIADGIRTGAIELGIAGGVESMSRAPFVMGKQATAFGRNAKLHDTTLGWRFVNRLIEEQYGVDSMADTAENVADGFLIARQDQDAFALRSQQRAEAAIEAGVFREEIVPVSIPQRGGDAMVVDTDEHPRPGSTIDGLAKLRPIVRAGGTVTAGNASGINDGACAMIVASEEAARRNQLEPLARVVGWAVAGVEPRIMGIGPAPATQKVLEQCGLTIEQMDLIELNEAFAAQALATLRQFGIPDDAGHVNPNGGAIALGHPLGMSGARLVTTATRQLQRTGGKFALCTMCVGVGQGIAMIIERV